MLHIFFSWLFIHFIKCLINKYIIRFFQYVDALCWRVEESTNLATHNSNRVALTEGVHKGIHHCWFHTLPPPSPPELRKSHGFIHWRIQLLDSMASSPSSPSSSYLRLFHQCFHSPLWPPRLPGSRKLLPPLRRQRRHCRFLHSRNCHLSRPFLYPVLFSSPFFTQICACIVRFLDFLFGSRECWELRYENREMLGLVLLCQWLNFYLFIYLFSIFGKCS